MSKRYRWASETTRVRQATGERFNAGDEIDPTDHELRAFGDYIEVIDEEDDEVVNVVEDVSEDDSE